MNMRHIQSNRSKGDPDIGILRIKEKIAMKLTTNIHTLTNSRAKLIGGLALGVLLMAGITGPLSADSPGTGPDGAAASRSVPASPEYLEFTQWEFPHMNGAVTKGSPALSSIPVSDGYLVFALGGEFPHMNGAVTNGSPALRSIPASDDYLAFTLWEFPGTRG